MLVHSRHHGEVPGLRSRSRRIFQKLAGKEVINDPAGQAREKSVQGQRTGAIYPKPNLKANTPRALKTWKR